MFGEAIFRCAGMAEFSLWVSPLADMSIIIKAAVCSLVLLALRMLAVMFEVVINVHSQKVTIVKLARAVGDFTLPVDGPK